jgi:Tfp pilus assembly protein PilF
MPARFFVAVSVVQPRRSFAFRQLDWRAIMVAVRGFVGCMARKVSVGNSLTSMVACGSLIFVGGCSRPAAGQPAEAPPQVATAETPAGGQTQKPGPSQSGPRAPTPQAEDNDAKAFLKRGDDYYADKDYDRAIGEYTEAIRRDPKSAAALGGRAHAYMAKGIHDQAIADADAALELDPKLFIAYYSRGFAFNHQKQFDKAIGDFTKAIEVKPKAPRSFYGRGNAYAGKGMWDRAIEDYTEAIKLNPDFTAAYRKRSIAYDKQGNRTLARADLQKARVLEKQISPAKDEDAPSGPQIGILQQTDVREVNNGRVHGAVTPPIELTKNIYVVFSGFFIIDPEYPEDRGKYISEVLVFNAGQPGILEKGMELGVTFGQLRDPFKNPRLKVERVRPPDGIIESLEFADQTPVMTIRMLRGMKSMRIDLDVMTKDLAESDLAILRKFLAMIEKISADRSFPLRGL